MTRQAGAARRLVDVRSRRLATAVAVILAWTAVSGPMPTVGATTTPDEPPSLRSSIIYHLQVATNIDGTPIDEGTSFLEGVPRVLTLVGWDFAPAGTRLRIRLFQDDRLVLDDERTVSRPRSGGFVFNFEPAGGVRAGQYTAQLDYNGVPDEVASFTVTAEPGSPAPRPAAPASALIPYADPADVLVVTRESVLRPQLGDRTDEVLAAARRVGDVRDLEADGRTRATAEEAVDEVRRLLADGRYRYLLILGNHDAVPFVELPNPVGADERPDLEGWDLPADWVPSDNPYTDLDGDRWGVPDLPIARIPSSDDAAVLLAQLRENLSPAEGVFALVNQKRRSQAGAVLEVIDDHYEIERTYSPPVSSRQIPGTGAASARYTYILLHGIGVTTDEWSGDRVAWAPENLADLDGPWVVRAGGQLDGMTVPYAGVAGGVVNVGACYGAWTLDTSQAPQHKTAENSLALRYLRAGSRAFVADTHLSYSALIGPDREPIARTGFEVLFWEALLGGATPIDAFHAAKIGIAQALDRAVARGDAEVAALDLKTLQIMIYLGRP